MNHDGLIRQIPGRYTITKKTVKKYLRDRFTKNNGLAMFTYKGYTGQVEVDAEADILFGTVLDINDVVTFQGKTVEEARQEFQNSVDFYLEFCQELGEEPERPFSGKLPYRTTPENHRKIFIAAKKCGKSINAWMDEVLAEMADRVLTN